MKKNIKKRIKELFIVLGKLSMQIVYFFLKWLPTQKKVLFLSRQSNKLPLDFKLIINELEDQNYKIVTICNRIEKEKDIYRNLQKFISENFVTMYHLATSKVCILDSYSLQVSVLKHKKNLKVIQIWHAMGKIKQSGYQTLDKVTGRSSKMAKLLRMHKNYDVVIAGAPAWNKAYSSSFGIEENKLINIGLPRADYIYNNQKQISDKIYKKYPSFKEKKVILYAPTFRVNNNGSVQKIIDNIDYDKYDLIVRCHPKQQLKIKNDSVYKCENVNIYELLTICDYFITDYSSLAVEAAALKKKTYYYLYDYNQYITTNGLNFDPLKELPTLSFKNAKELIKNIDKDIYDMKALLNYRKKYVPKDFQLATKKIADYIKEVINHE